MRIVLTGGGTGGHIIPLIAVAQKIKEKNPETQFLFIGPRGILEKKLMEAQGIPSKYVLVGKLRRYFSFRYCIDIFKVPLGIIQTLVYLLFYMPDAIFSKGGYASFPVVVVGWLYRIPILIHDSDANPGLANTFLAKFSDRVAVSYARAEKYFLAKKVVLTGNPLRTDINQGEAQKAREKFSLLESKKVIFVWGGSQGAQAINNKILDILPDLLKRYQVIHQTGEKNFKEVEHKAGVLGIKNGRRGYFALPFIEEGLKDILAVADLIISRSGSNSISEIAANGKASIIIPLANSANNHQRMNAYAIAKTGGCIVLEEANLGATMLFDKINKIMNDAELKEKLEKNVKKFYHPEAAEKIADGVLGMLK